ncbi:MAG: Lrp/AsnC ligand binding domain-containing protein [Thaumarchaeota archaeon]|jgi:AsnC-like helix-turn-helix protein|nr:Lrp/AsnC ligand binding domain-containing protein [Nitrososphaerota archaeon]
MAYVLVRTKPGTSHDLLASRKIPNVKLANSVFGTYDAVLVIAAKDMEDLSSTIYDIVEKHPNVEHTEVLVSIPWPPAEKPVPPQEYDPVMSFNCPSCNSLNERGSTYCHFCGYVF